MWVKLRRAVLHRLERIGHDRQIFIGDVDQFTAAARLLRFPRQPARPDRPCSAQCPPQPCAARPAQHRLIRGYQAIFVDRHIFRRQHRHDTRIGFGARVSIAVMRAWTRSENRIFIQTWPSISISPDKPFRRSLCPQHRSGECSGQPQNLFFTSHAPSEHIPTCNSTISSPAALFSALSPRFGLFEVLFHLLDHRLFIGGRGRHILQEPLVGIVPTRPPATTNIASAQHHQPQHHSRDDANACHC